jgi:hypothetical protein
MDERVWRLPGPRGFVREIVAEHRRGRHVASVLPEALAADPVFTDSLGVALLEEFASQSVSARRIHDAGPGVSVLETFCQALIFDDQPATIPDLLIHAEVRDVVAVVVARDLGSPAREELPAFLRRVELESHATGTARRLAVVAVVSRDQLPAFAGGASSDITLTSIWWWARMARWDVAAYIAGLAGQPRLSGVLEEVRTESIVELARWDLDLAERLAAAWSGELDALSSLLRECGPTANGRSGHAGKGGTAAGTWNGAIPNGAGTNGAGPAGAGLQPPGPDLDLWDRRAVDGWHDRQSVTAGSLAASPEKLSRVIWAAQARVLLPWIEERRSALLDQVTQELGPGRLAEVLGHRFSPPVKPDALVEIGVLDKVVQMVIGSRNPGLRDASRRLREARNCLAHMQPLSLAEQESLVAACAYLA